MYNPELDVVIKELDPIELDNDSNRMFFKICSYDGGEPKLQILKEFHRPPIGEGQKTTKMGRLDFELLQMMIDRMNKAVDFLDSYNSPKQHKGKKHD